MRLRAIVLLLLVLCGPAWGQQKIDGESLSTFCADMGALCVGFMSGAVAGLQTNSSFRDRVCFPDDVTLQTLTSTAIDYQATNNFADVPAIMVLVLAYAEEYPCAD